MTTIVLDPLSTERLRSVGSSAEIRDQFGHLLGYYRPVARPADVEPYECPVPDHELDRRTRQGGGRALAEIIGDLERALEVM